MTVPKMTATFLAVEKTIEHEGAKGRRPRRDGFSRRSQTTFRLLRFFALSRQIGVARARLGEMSPSKYLQIQIASSRLTNIL
jgi:hypothetical protein